MKGARGRLATLVWAAACGGTSGAPDADSDGVPDYEDCAPNDASRFPGSAEVCDGVDNDCDRTVDDDLVQTWFVDVDGDGHGDPARHTDTCSPAPGLVTVGDDCDDVQADVFPGAVELCDDKDNDCANGVDDVRWATDFGAAWPQATATTTGDAAILTDPSDGNAYLRMVRAQPDLQGGLWFLPRVPGARWRLRFRLRISGAGGLPGEGLAFSFVSSDVGPVIGGGGAQLGIYGANVDGSSLEFDVGSNGPDDAPSGAPHLAFQRIRDGALVAERPNPPNMEEGVWHQVEYLQDGPAFSVRIDGATAWEGTVALDPSALVTMGFTAATSRSRRMQFALDDIELACPDTPAGGGPTDSAMP